MHVSQGACRAVAAAHCANSAGLGTRLLDSSHVGNEAGHPLLGFLLFAFLLNIVALDTQRLRGTHTQQEHT
jgi:hypothetical protein